MVGFLLSCSHWMNFFCFGFFIFGNVMECTLSLKMGEKTPPLFSQALSSSPLKSANYPISPFSLCTPSPLKKQIFQWTRIVLKLKVTKVLVKRSQQNIFFYKPFLSLNILDFSVFFVQKLHPKQIGGYTVLEAFELRTDRLQGRRS